MTTEREMNPPDLGCRLPQRDWYCSREPGHEGPCAARRFSCLNVNDGTERGSPWKIVPPAEALAGLLASPPSSSDPEMTTELNEKVCAWCLYPESSHGGGATACPAFRPEEALWDGCFINGAGECVSEGFCIHSPRLTLAEVERALISIVPPRDRARLMPQMDSLLRMVEAISLTPDDAEAIIPLMCEKDWQPKGSALFAKLARIRESR